MVSSNLVDTCLQYVEHSVQRVFSTEWFVSGVLAVKLHLILNIHQLRLILELCSISHLEIC